MTPSLFLPRALSTLLAFSCVSVAADAPRPGATTVRSIDVDGRRRSYRVHVPKGLTRRKNAPLVLMFHGGGGSARKIEASTGFSSLADRKGFVVAYPDAVGGNWNDGRGCRRLRSHRLGIDDVAFARRLIDTLCDELPIDRDRVFATGASNGGMMCHRLAIEASDRVAAIAPLIGGIAEPLAKTFAPQHPVSILVIQGTEDPLVPFSGGNVGFLGRRGAIIATTEAVERWARHDRCEPTPRVARLPDADPEDGCTVTRSTWRGAQADVEFLRVDGGGHTWPGGPQYRLESIIGRVCRDFDATRAIWRFFAAHPRGVDFVTNGVTAHRGDSGALPENTMRAFRSALQSGADWIEIDIVETRDGHLVVTHDLRTGRVADRDVAIPETNWVELQKLDVAHGFRTGRGLTTAQCPPARMPLLEEVVDLVRAQKRVRLSIQPKTDSVDKAVAVIGAKNATRWCGFNDGSLAKMARVKELDPRLWVFWDRPATSDVAADIATARKHGFESLVIEHTGVTREKVTRVRKAGLEFGAWTVNEPAKLSALLELGVERIYTDFPRRLLGLRKAR